MQESIKQQQREQQQQVVLQVNIVHLINHIIIQQIHVQRVQQERIVQEVQVVVQTVRADIQVIPGQQRKISVI